MVTVVRTRNSNSLEWQRKHKFTRQWLFEGLTEPMGLWEEIPAEVQGWGWSRYELWLAEATITLLKYISTSLCQVLKRLYTFLIQLYHLSHRHTWLEMSREFPRHLQLKLSFPPADRQPSQCLWIPGERRRLAGRGFGMTLCICLIEGQWSCHVNRISVRNLLY